MRKASLITVKVILRKKNALVVESVVDNNISRKVVLLSQVYKDEGKTVVIEKSELEKGIEYGVPWEDLIKECTITSEKMASELRINGIWTAEDAVSNPGIVQSAILSACRAILSDVMQISKSFIKKEK